MNIKPISVEETQKILATDASVLLLDVRTPQEYKSGHLANSLLIPVQELELRVHELGQYKERTIIAYCRTGNRSGRAAAILMNRGFSAMNMEGGIVRWNEMKFPVVHETPR
jgi:rhodanese-related sulfurtransferase